MALSATTARALQQASGDAAADDLVKWVHDMEASRIELRELSELQVQRFAALVDARFANQSRELSAALHEHSTALRKEMQTGMAALRAELRQATTELRVEMHKTTTELRAEMHKGATDLRTEMHDRFNVLLKWSFVFWCGAVGAVAALARVFQ